ncbi:hypothetical protein ID866_11484 [Astraeus odoratus]|nr:hypothetical protein ID866_11484 [Astraeus odoratus]
MTSANSEFLSWAVQMQARLRSYKGGATLLKSLKYSCSLEICNMATSTSLPANYLSCVS